MTVREFAVLSEALAAADVEFNIKGRDGEVTHVGILRFPNLVTFLTAVEGAEFTASYSAGSGFKFVPMPTHTVEVYPGPEGDLDTEEPRVNEQMIVTIRMPSKFYPHFKAAPMTGEILSAERESPDQRRT